MGKVALHFVMTIDVEEDYADELGRDICHDIFHEMFNGEDVFDIVYDKYEVVRD